MPTATLTNDGHAAFNAFDVSYSFSAGGSTLQVGAGGFVIRLALIRFGLNVAQGAEITSATLQLFVFAPQDEPQWLRCLGCDRDDPAWPVDGNSAINLLNDATAAETVFAVQVDPEAEGAPVSIDVTPILQEIVDRPLWEAGNHIIMLLWVSEDPFTAGFSTFAASESEQESWPGPVLVYEIGEGGPAEVAATSLAWLLIEEDSP